MNIQKLNIMMKKEYKKPEVLVQELAMQQMFASSIEVTGPADPDDEVGVNAENDFNDLLW
ncbi:MAG: hypothetical protein IKA86_02825 [Paraprevotella sp.]|nr:hypothetical protein [Paraprevotella sp.]